MRWVRKSKARRANSAARAHGGHDSSKPPKPTSGVQAGSGWRRYREGDQAMSYADNLQACAGVTTLVVFQWRGAWYIWYGM